MRKIIQHSDSRVGGRLGAALWLPAFAALVWSVEATFVAAAPPYEIRQTPELCYVAKGTWFDSMLASRAALQAEEAAGIRPAPSVAFHSDVIRGREPARDISVPISGTSEIYLYVTGAPDVEYGAGDWIAPRAIDGSGKATLLCSGKFLNIQQGFHTVDCSLRSRVDPPLLIADEPFEHGINLQAPGKIRVAIPDGTVWFEAKIGLDDWVNPEHYKLPQPQYYQPHHFLTAAKRKPSAKSDLPPNGAVRFHVTDAAGAARLDLWTHLADAFSEAEPRRQMKWEREDRLLEEDWAPGDWQGLSVRYAKASGRVAGTRAEALRVAKTVVDRAGFDRVRAIYHRSRQVDQAAARAGEMDFDSVRDAVQDLIATFGADYPEGREYLRQLARVEKQVATALKSYRKIQDSAHSVWEPNAALHTTIVDLLERFDALRHVALTSNPLECRLRGVRALGFLGGPGASNAILKAIAPYRNRDYSKLTPLERHFVQGGLRSLGRLRQPESLEPFVGFFDKVGWARYAADALGDFGSPKAVLPLIAALRLRRPNRGFRIHWTAQEIRRNQKPGCRQWCPQVCRVLVRFAAICRENRGLRVRGTFNRARFGPVG